MDGSARVTHRLLLIHDRPRADGGESKRRDVLIRAHNGYRIEWSSSENHPPESLTLYRTVEAALVDWYGFPRKGEQRAGGRAPRGFEAARRKARER